MPLPFHTFIRSTIHAIHHHPQQSQHYSPISTMSHTVGTGARGAIKPHCPIKVFASMSDVSVPLALAAVGLPSMLYRSCVDCGLQTACSCNYCFAIERVPTEVWTAGQSTPLCAGCRNRHGSCHYCRGIPWVTPPPWTPQVLCELCTSSSTSNAYGTRTEWQRRGRVHHHMAIW